jgi:hypothetical protein
MEEAHRAAARRRSMNLRRSRRKKHWRKRSIHRNIASTAWPETCGRNAGETFWPKKLTEEIREMYVVEA